jgi:hypothetical protein
LPKGAALLLGDANDGVRRPVHAQLLPQRVYSGEEMILDIGPDNGDPGGTIFVRFGEAPALLNVEVLQRRHLPGVAANLRVCHRLRSAHDRSGRRLLRPDPHTASAVVPDVDEVGIKHVFSLLKALVVL